MKPVTLQLKVNGKSYTLPQTRPRTLLEVLREDLNLYGVKPSCLEGACGACTVLMNGKPVLSCITLAADAQGKDIVTIEGLSHDGKPHPLQEAFVKHGAVQCGFCTTGMILSAKALLDRQPHPSEAEIRHAISGNLCRCTGYQKIIEAIQAAAGTR